MTPMRRREFITLAGGATAMWPTAARAQQSNRMRRIGALMTLAADDPEAQARNAAFLQGLSELGWTVGRNVQIDYRWGTGDPERYRRQAAELIALAPDVILTNGAAGTGAMQQATQTVPVVFVQVTDPVGAGYVAGLSRPGGNMTGFTLFEYSTSGKWLELLKQIAPNVTRVAVLRDPTTATGLGQFAAIQSVAQPLGVVLSPVGLRDAAEIERAITALARAPNSGLIITSGAFAILHRDLIVALAARHRLPAIYSLRFFVTGGGLISYGTDSIEPYRLAAGYIDRILKGEKPADLPVQAPVKYETVLNMKTAKALGLDVPPTVLVRADEVIE
jgi:putative ABC transport system substrate-binding protein